MIPTFANVAGAWALLGIPAVVAIHFLQQKSRTVRSSTMFLMEALAPESKEGRRLERLRLSRAFWLQIAAVLLAAWVLAEPRWVRDESAQVVVAVLDDSLSMRVFHGEAVRAAGELFSKNEGRAARTEWVVITSNARQPALYRGTDKRAALAAAAAWRPSSGTHDCGAALRLGRALAGASGVSWFFTDRRGRAPADQPTAGVGRTVRNAGFAGARCSRDEWRALVRNYSDTPLAREWWVESGGGRSAARRIEIEPGGLLELSAKFPEGADSCVLTLAGDEFAADDRLPLVRPAPKRLAVSVEMAGASARAFFQKLAAGVPGVEFVPRGAGAAVGLRLADLQDGDTAPAKGAAIFVARAAGGAAGGADAKRPVRTAPVVAERHALTAGLNWQGLVGTGAAGLRRGAGAEVLLWQGGEALAWVENQQLFFNFDWEAGNAARLPSLVLLARRFIEETRAGQEGGYAANFDAGARVRAGGGGEVAGALTLESADGARELGAAETAVLRAPLEAGFFTVRRGGDVLVRGAAQFADARQGDFRECASFVSGAPDAGAERERLIRNSRGDPLVNVWLLAMSAALLWSWWPRARARKGETSGQTPRISRAA